MENLNIGEIFVTALSTMFSIIFKVFSIFLIPLALIVFIIIICVIYHYIYFRYVKNIKPKKKEYIPPKRPGLFKNLFYLFPKQLSYDILTRDPNEFNEYGIHMIVGEQGSGKTMTAVYLFEKWKSMYPNLEIYTNMEYKRQDGGLDTWIELLSHNNGIYGVVNCIDEIKTWWSNRDSKDVPPEILGEICQQRKQRKATIGTVQVFSELAKPFRSQTHFVYIPITIFGCLTIVLQSKPKYYDMENDRFKKYTNFFVFAHTPRLRNAYDTYKKIEKYKNVEFGVSSAFTSSNCSEQAHTQCVEVAELKIKKR